MPISFGFEDQHGSLVTLDEIDRKICTDFNLNVDDESYSFMFDLISLIGDLVMKEGKFDESEFERVMKKVACVQSSSEVSKIRNYLDGDYKYFSCTYH
jgi:hypothetical protein